MFRLHGGDEFQVGSLGCGRRGIRCRAGLGWAGPCYASHYWAGLGLV